MEPVAWAVERWNAEVKNRPLQNIHRAALDTTWRQVIRHFGGDPDALVGSGHYELASKSGVGNEPGFHREGRMSEELDEKALSAAWMRFVRVSCGYQGRDTLGEAIRVYLAAAPAAATIERLTQERDDVASTLARTQSDHAAWVQFATDQQKRTLAAEAALAKAQQERDEHLRLKNELVLKAYPVMDAVDRIRNWIDAQQYENDLITVVQLRELLGDRTNEAKAALAEARALLKSALHHVESEGDDTLAAVIRAALAPAKTVRETLALTATLLPPPDKCPPAYHGCMCECHRVPGIVHVAACCAPGPNDDWPDQQYWYERAALAPSKTVGETKPDPTLHARTSPGPINCNTRLRLQAKAGDPIPKSCERCGLGPCPFFFVDGQRRDQVLDARRPASPETE